jgi:hypothetical protein
MLDQPNVPPKRVSDSVVNKLAALMVEAKRGNIEAVAIVAVFPDGEPRVHFAGEGDLVASINLGVDMLKSTIMDRIRQVQMNSGIVLPGRG